MTFEAWQEELEPEMPGRWIDPDDPETWVVRVYPTYPVIVYRFYDAEPLLLYVGITMAPEKRFKSHYRRSVWWPEISRLRVMWAPNRQAALRSEALAIRYEGPIWNRAGNERGLMWASRARVTH